MVMEIEELQSGTHGKVLCTRTMLWRFFHLILGPNEAGINQRPKRSRYHSSTSQRDMLKFFKNMLNRLKKRRAEVAERCWVVKSSGDDIVTICTISQNLKAAYFLRRMRGKTIIEAMYWNPDVKLEILRNRSLFEILCQKINNSFHLEQSASRLTIQVVSMGLAKSKRLSGSYFCKCIYMLTSILSWIKPSKKDVCMIR